MMLSHHVREKNIQGKNKDVIKHNSFKPIPEQIEHFKEVVNEFINYIKNDYGLILKYTK